MTPSHHDESFSLEKTLWTHHDFPEMGWHDNPVHAFSMNYREEDHLSDLVLDIDYIFKWVLDDTTDPPCYKFWISPCTLVFHDIQSEKFDLDKQCWGTPPIWGITRKELSGDKTSFLWEIELLDFGSITFQASGFSQYTRSKPILLGSQKLTMAQRGGISFQQQTYDNITDK